MKAALALGRRGMGQVAPNPAVAALVVKDGIVLGRGVTAPGGRPHAEPLALAEAGAGARGATLYVTLEPCSHHGRTPPCVDAVLAAGIARVVLALEDPDARVAGRGIARLREQSVAVRTGVCECDARQEHLGHCLRVTEGRPAVTVKMAETLDGYAARLFGAPRLLITSPVANARVQMLRATHDAIMVGVGTALEDDPLLTLRLPGLERVRPLRIVLDSYLRLPVSSRLVQTARAVPLAVITGLDAPRERMAELAAAGVDIHHGGASLDGRLALGDVVRSLGQLGVTRVLCEGGPQLASALVDQDLADSVILLTGPQPLGEPGRRSFAPVSRARLDSARRYILRDEVRLGPDRMRTFERRVSACSLD